MLLFMHYLDGSAERIAGGAGRKGDNRDASSGS